MPSRILVHEMGGDESADDAEQEPQQAFHVALPKGVVESIVPTDSVRSVTTRALYVEILIRAPLDRVWELTQDVDLHPRWDARFSAIRPTGVRDDGARTFRYELALGVRTIRGTGVSLSEKRAAGGPRTSALVFDADDRLSPLRRGRGYWRYVPHPEGVRFITGYDYQPWFGAFGRLLDRVLIRHVVWWLTAWSFDRLRLWAESGIEPERVTWWRGWLRGPRARARSCLSRPSAHNGRDVMAAAPDSLSRIRDHD